MKLRRLGELAVSFDDWQAIYRQILQVERARAASGNCSMTRRRR